MEERRNKEKRENGKGRKGGRRKAEESKVKINK